MWQSSNSTHGVHLVRRVAHPLDSTHGKYALGQVLEIDVAQLARGAGMGRRWSSRRGQPDPSNDSAGERQSAGGESRDPRSSDVRQMLFLDTETTGLGGPGTYVFLVGLGYLEDDAFVVRQHFIRSPEEEPAMLQAVADTLAQWPVFTSFNGLSFDIPLLRTRMRANKIKANLWRNLHCDLLIGARRLWQRRLPNCQLQTLEAHVLDFRRQGDVPSAEVPRMYFDYLKTGDLSSLEGVFHHNVLDIISLAGLMVAMHEHIAEADHAKR